MKACRSGCRLAPDATAGPVVATGPGVVGVVGAVGCEGWAGKGVDAGDVVFAGTVEGPLPGAYATSQAATKPSEPSGPRTFSQRLSACRLPTFASTLLSSSRGVICPLAGITAIRLSGVVLMVGALRRLTDPLFGVSVRVEVSGVTGTAPGTST